MNSRSHTRRAVLTAGTGLAGAALAACGGCSVSGGDRQQPSVPAGQPLASLGDVPVGGAMAVATAQGQDVVVSRPSSSTVAGFSALCTHQGCKVAVEGAELRCPCHGSVFDAFTGQARHGPARTPLTTIHVQVEGNQIVTAAPPA